MIRVLILAHGDGYRWNDYLGAPKHFVEIDGETLIGRTVRLFSAHTDDVVVVGPDQRYDIPPARLVSYPPRPDDGEIVHRRKSDMCKFTDVRELWSDDGRTVIVWGDCYCTAELVADICSPDAPPRYHVWRRPGPNRETGHRWDESFAVSFAPGDHPAVIEACRQVDHAIATGRLSSAHVRTHLAAYCGLRVKSWDDLGAVAALPNQTHVGGISDDFDTPAEWAGWVGRYYAGKINVVVCIPWTGGDTWRTQALGVVVAHYAALGVPVRLGDDPTIGSQWPNRAAARNAAAAKAVADYDPEVLFFADADTVVDAVQFWAACYLAQLQRRLVLAFDTYLKLRRQVTDTICRTGVIPTGRNARTIANGAQTVFPHHASGALAVPVSLWDQVGGYDERFLSWGGEDRAFWLACNMLGGEAARVVGPAYHLYHPPAADKVRTDPQYLANIDLGMQYKRAAGVTVKTGALPEDVEIGPPDLDAMLAVLRASLNTSPTRDIIATD